MIGVCDARGVQADPRWSRFRAIGIPESDAVCDAVIGRCESPVDIDRAVLRQAVTDAAWARLAELTEGRVDVTAHSADGEPASGAMVLLRREDAEGAW